MLCCPLAAELERPLLAPRKPHPPPPPPPPPPFARVGEVAAAVVLKDGESATEADIREFAATHLADFKVPRKVVFLEEIPKGATGKLQRIGLHEKLGL